MSKIRLRTALRPGPRWGAYSAPPGPLAGLKGSISKGMHGGVEREAFPEQKVATIYISLGATVWAAPFGRRTFVRQAVTPPVRKLRVRLAGVIIYSRAITLKTMFCFFLRLCQLTTKHDAAYDKLSAVGSYYN